MKPKNDRSRRTGPKNGPDGAALEATEAAGSFPIRLLLKDSLTYRLIWEAGWLDGAIAEAKKLLFLLGEQAFGPADSRTAAAIKQLNDLARLEELLKRLRTAGNWQELLPPPAPGRRARRRPSP